MNSSSVVVCVDTAKNSAAVIGLPCGEGQGLTAVQAVLVSPADSPYNAVQGSGFFFFGFGVVVFGYLLGFVVAAVRKPIRQGSS